MSEKVTYSPDQQAELSAVIEVIRDNGGKATLDEIYEAFSKKPGYELDEKGAADLNALMETSSAETCIFIPGETRCLYITDQGNGTYVLEENKEAAKGSADDASADQKNSTEGMATPAGDKNPVGITPNDDIANVVEPFQATDKVNRADSEQDVAIAETEGSIERDNSVITKEEDKIKKHEEQIAKDKTRLMKDIHKMEIHHDKDVIARKEADLDMDNLLMGDE